MIWDINRRTQESWGPFQKLAFCSILPMSVLVHHTVFAALACWIKQPQPSECASTTMPLDREQYFIRGTSHWRSRCFRQCSKCLFSCCQDSAECLALRSPQFLSLMQWMHGWLSEKYFGHPHQITSHKNKCLTPHVQGWFLLLVYSSFPTPWFKK